MASLEAIAEVAGTGDNAPAHIVLLSDGANTVGRPISAAVEQARAAGVPVSTIAYGTPDGVVQVGLQLIRVPVDAAALAGLAEQTGGRSYAAQNGDELKGVYDDIGSSVGTKTERHEVSGGVAGVALLLAVGAAASAVLLSPRLV